jgi:hypothetical protein
MAAAPSSAWAPSHWLLPVLLDLSSAPPLCAAGMPVRPQRPGWVRGTYYAIRRKHGGRGLVGRQKGLLTVRIGLITDGRSAQMAQHPLEDLGQHEPFLVGQQIDQVVANAADVRGSRAA